MIAAFVAGVTVGDGRLLGAEVLGGGEVPCLAGGTEVGTEEGSVGATHLDKIAGLPGVCLARVTAFGASPSRLIRQLIGFERQWRVEFIQIDGCRVKAQTSEESVDPF